MTISVEIEGKSVEIQREVFCTLLKDSVGGGYAAYRNALDAGKIKLVDLVELSRKGNIPYSLFFASPDVVSAQVEIQTDKLLSGLSKDTFQVGTRASVHLSEVMEIVKDLVRKQELLKQSDPSLEKNKVVGVLYKASCSPEECAKRLMEVLKIDPGDFATFSSKSKALEFFVQRLEANQVLVSRSAEHYMPQTLRGVKFSGLAIRDPKIPYIFLAGGDHGDHQEPVGRSLFTLALMTVLVARRVFATVTWDARSISSDLGVEFDIAGAMLMPESRMRQIPLNSLADFEEVSEEFKVTPSAVVVRAKRLGLIDVVTTHSYLEELGERFAAQGSGPRRSLRPQNGVKKYCGQVFCVRMLDALDAGKISTGEFCRSVCLNKLDKTQIPLLREAVA